jgi:hypothetical protein
MPAPVTAPEGNRITLAHSISGGAHRDSCALPSLARTDRERPHLSPKLVQLSLLGLVPTLLPRHLAEQGTPKRWY